MLYLIIRFIAFILYKILFRLQAFGRKNIPLKGGFILASNHTSFLDPPALAVACPRIVHFLAKEGLFRNVLFGRFISALNAFPLKTHSADIKALRWAVDVLQAGKTVIIFPEGGRTPDGQLDQPLKGVGFLAAKANVPVVPAFIEGSYQAWPPDRKLFRPGKIKIYFGRPIAIDDIKLEENEDAYQEIAEKIMQEIANLKQESRKR